MMGKHEPIDVRLSALTMPEPNSGCHLFIGSLSRDGYGYLGVERKTRRAHRVAFELANGPIPDGLEIDHLCRVRACVNPRHLEAVPHHVNVLRGQTLAGINARKTACPKGHPYTDENTLWGDYPRGRKKRSCRACSQARFQSPRGRQTRPVGSKPPFRGITYLQRWNKWQSQIQARGRSEYLGVFATAEEAARVYDARARQLHGARARLNFPNEVQTP